MAFQMIHMEIAYRLLKRISPISNPAEFIIGSVAPDSVHMNPDYDVIVNDVNSFCLTLGKRA